MSSIGAHTWMIGSFNAVNGIRRRTTRFSSSKSGKDSRSFNAVNGIRRRTTDCLKELLRSLRGFNAVNGIRRRTTAYPAKAVNMPALKLILI